MGSTRYTLDGSGSKTAEMRYYPWGSTHYSSNPTGTPRRQFTGQMNDGDTGLYYYNARYYEPALARFVQADTIVPDPKDPQSFNRYAYALNSPIVHNDPSGHCVDGISTLVCIAGGLLLLSEVIDYGITIYDGANAVAVLADENSSPGDRLLAGADLGIAALTEAAEPDEWLPGGLPLDDLARKTLLKEARDILANEGEDGLVRYLRGQLGDDITSQIIRQSCKACIEIFVKQRIQDIPNMGIAGTARAKGSRYVEGGVDEAVAFFNQLTTDYATSISALADGRMIAKLPDGTNVIFNPSSSHRSGGVPTIYVTSDLIGGQWGVRFGTPP